MRTERITAAVEAVRAFAESRRSQNGTPSYQIALTDRDGLLASIEIGLANFESGAPVEQGTLYQIGSIGKSFTAICLLQLAEEGRIDLHAPIQIYLPWFSVQTEYDPITTHHLLSHTSGLICGTDFTPGHQFEVWSLRNTKTTTQPGCQFHYSNVGYKALGFVLEAVEGRTYGEIVRDRILEPLGMTNARAEITSDMRHLLAVGYQSRFDDRPALAKYGLVPAPWLESNSGDGSISASASELAIYLRMLLNQGAYPGGRLLSEESFRLMTTAHIDTGDGGFGYGYGLAMQTEPASGLFGHSGGMVGYIAAMDGNSETGFGAVVLTNSMVNCSAISLFALDALAKAASDEPIPTPKPPERPPLSDYVGAYHGAIGALEIGMASDDLVLVRDGVTSTLEQAAYPPDVYINDAPGERHFAYRFERDEAGTVTGVVHGEREWTKGDHSDLAQLAPSDYSAYVGHFRSYNPWGSNFRIVVRGGRLLMIAPSGGEAELIPDGDWFRVESDEGLPEALVFDTIVAGRALQARDQLGSTFQRVFTP